MTKSVLCALSHSIHGLGFHLPSQNCISTVQGESSHTLAGNNSVSSRCSRWQEWWADLGSILFSVLLLSQPFGMILIHGPCSSKYQDWTFSAQSCRNLRLYTHRLFRITEPLPCRKNICNSGCCIRSLCR